MHEMNREEWWAFASAGTRTGKVAVTRRDGQALVSAIWFLLNEVPGADPHDEIVFTTHESGAKAKILRREQRLSLLVDDQAPPYSYVQFQATAELTTDPDELRRWAAAIGGRYMGSDRAEEYGRRNGVPGEFLVRARIRKVLAVADIAD